MHGLNHERGYNSGCFPQFVLLIIINMSAQPSQNVTPPTRVLRSSTQRSTGESSTRVLRSSTNKKFRSSTNYKIYFQRKQWLFPTFKKYCDKLQLNNRTEYWSLWINELEAIANDPNSSRNHIRKAILLIVSNLT